MELSKQMLSLMCTSHYRASISNVSYGHCLQEKKAGMIDQIEGERVGHVDNYGKNNYLFISFWLNDNTWCRTWIFRVSEQDPNMVGYLKSH